MNENKDKRKYEYYYHMDNFEQEEKNPKKWKTRIIGGDIGLEPRVKYDLGEKTPGPGRYEDQYKKVRPKTPAYFLAERTGFGAIKQLIGTGDEVGPGRYDVQSAKYTSKHRIPPAYKFGKYEGRDIFNKTWAKHETYEVYSCVGNQTRSKKRTEPRAKIGKSTRDREAIRGTFNCMMDRQPMRVNIPMPKF